MSTLEVLVVAKGGKLEIGNVSNPELLVGHPYRNARWRAGGTSEIVKGKGSDAKDLLGWILNVASRKHTSMSKLDQDRYDNIVKDGRALITFYF